MSELSELNQQVTAAILRAEGASVAESAIAYHEVSRLEEAIAALTLPDSAEGGYARDGAVRAALSAGDRQRAQLLARRYLSEPGAHPALAATLAALLNSWRLSSEET